MLKMGSLEDQINQRDFKTIIGSPRELHNYKHSLKKKQQERLMNVKQSKAISYQSKKSVEEEVQIENRSSNNVEKKKVT
jgi:hypothetical protein